MRIAIVSSIDESCGNATFSEHLISSLSNDENTTIGVPLNLHLTQGLDAGIRKAANNHISKIVRELGNFDGVNIQFEPGLYGKSHKDICNRLDKLIKANKNTSVTLHSVRIINSTSLTFNRVLKNLAYLRIRNAIKLFAELRNSKRVLKQNRKYIEICIKNSAKLIVHTKRSEKLIKSIFNYEQVATHPIKFVERDDFQNLGINWHAALGFSKSDKLIGIFGFISKYKGHHDAIQALSMLPENHKLVICGRQHPGSIEDNQEINDYLEKIILQIEKLGLTHRVRFLNEVSNEELFDLASYVDFAWLPYLETGQDGSGIASIIFDLSKKVIASNCKAFDELLTLIPQYKCERFDIGNYLELASKTLHYRELRNFSDILPYSNNTQSILYRRSLSI